MIRRPFTVASALSLAHSYSYMVTIPWWAVAIVAVVVIGILFVTLRRR